MIELAPHHKIGLPLTGPVMIASGCAGFGTAYQRLLDLSTFGAIVTQPITLRPRRGPAQPRLVETKAGFILNTGGQNPGVRQVIRRHSPAWSRLGRPVIAHLPADEPDDLRRTARALASTDKIAAIELGVPPDATRVELERWGRAIRVDCHLPLLVKLPLDDAPVLAETAADGWADSLVVGAPPLGSAVSPTNNELISGYLFGPMLHSLTLQALQIVTELVDLPLVAVGGVHSLADAQAFLQAGATAVQLDSLLFIDPKQAEHIAQNIGGG